MKTSIVLGLALGDEGKGKTVDWLCGHNRSAVVVRFSGGQQCGHTVINAKGKHIHASFPSGTLAGHTGYISEHCTVSPIHLYNEWLHLKKKGHENVGLIVHPLAPVTTLFDIVAGRRDSLRKGVGTCGMGVGATMTRHHQSPVKIHFIDLYNDFILQNKLEAIRDWYGKKEQQNRESLDYIRMNARVFTDGVRFIRSKVRCQDYSIIKHENLIFEGSQGILLDMDHGHFPHVTYANTTSKNAVEILNKIGRSHWDTYYVTRAYATRHGTGPFLKGKIQLKNTEEEINVKNKWQGEFKVAPHDPNLLKHAFEVDKIYNPNSKQHLCVTCLDQVKRNNVESLYHHFAKVHLSSTPHSEYTDKNKTKRKIF